MASAEPELLLFANPGSGRGLGLAAAARAERRLNALSRASRLVTDRGQLATRLAAGSAAPAEVWVCGGDGTLAEFANHLPPGVRPVIGLLPTGTGNVVARTLGIPLGLDAAVDVALTAPPRRLDLGRVNGCAFTFMASAGIDGEIAGRVAARRSGPMRRGDWVRAALGVGRTARETPFTISADGEPLGTFRWAALFNCGLYAGSFRVCPSAQVDDGRLELLALRDAVAPRFVRVIFAALRGRVARLPDATLVSARSAKFSGAEAVQVDGDPMQGGPLEFGLDPEPLRIRAPLSCGR
jgi:diacylglycerol kinase family enzyme